MTALLAAHLGEICSLLAALSWAFASLLFTSGANEFGAGNLNRLRLLFASVALVTLMTTSSGWGWLVASSWPNLLLLGLSGIIGLVIGDRLYLSALTQIGPRISTQLFALTPIWATFIAAILLGELPSLTQTGGIVLVISGVSLVASMGNDKLMPSKSYAKGLLYGAIASVCQALAFVLAKYAMGEGISALQGNTLRMVCAGSVIWILAGLQGKAGSSFKVVTARRSLVIVVCATILGPTLGVWLALTGITHSKVGVASTLMSLTPLFVIPLVAILHREKISWIAIIGATIAFAGVAIIFLS